MQGWITVKPNEALGTAIAQALKMPTGMPHTRRTLLDLAREARENKNQELHAYYISFYSRIA